MAKARSKPVKPAFVVKAGNDKVIWDRIRDSTQTPKVDSCRKLASGDYLLPTTDIATETAIRSMVGSSGISITESMPRKPNVKMNRYTT